MIDKTLLERIKNNDSLLKTLDLECAISDAEAKP